MAGGTASIPSSKSLGHRSLICAGIASFTNLRQAPSVIRHLDDSQDIQATLQGLASAGVRAERHGKECIVFPSRPFAQAVIDCGESGSTLRFLVPVLTALGIRGTYIGHGRLPERPMKAYYQLFDEHGISYTTKEGKLPLTVSGKFTPGIYEIDASDSSQFVSGLLLALPLLGKDSCVKVRGRIVSRPYIDLTLGAMKSFGVQIREEHSMPQETVFSVLKGEYLPAEYTVEPDASQAAFLILAGGIAADERGLLISGLKPDTLQGDIAFVKVFEHLGGRCRWEREGLRVFRSFLHGTITVNVDDCPDTVPALSLLGAYSQGKLTMTGAGRLRLKESDRLEAVVEELSAIGVKASATADTLTVLGSGTVRGGTVKSHNDHRMAMALAAAGLGSREGITVTHSSCVAKSWPDYYTVLDHIRQSC